MYLTHSECLDSTVENRNVASLIKSANVFHHINKLERSKSYKLVNYVEYVTYAPIYCAEVNIGQRNKLYSTPLFLVV
jgi:hypothetical protein